MRRTIITTIIFALIAASQALGTSYAPPQRQVISSANGKFTVTIDPKTDVHKVRKKDEQTVLWQFKKSVWHDQWIISDDGKKVVWIAWRWVQQDKLDQSAIIVFSNDGSQKSYTFKQVSDPGDKRPKAMGPIGDFWRIWQAGVKVTNETVTVATIAKDPASISLK